MSFNICCGFFFFYLEYCFSFIAITFYKSNPTAFIILQSLLSYFKILIIYKPKVGPHTTATSLLLFFTQVTENAVFEFMSKDTSELFSASKRALCNIS